MPAADFSSDEARRVALAAQGFDRPRPRRRVGARDLRRVIRQLGLLSIVPVETWPLLRHRMERHRVRPYGFERFLASNAAYAEPGARPDTVAEALAVELKTMASWLGLEAVGVERRGNLARPLAAAVRE